jgi:hypothetical protein
LQIKQQLAPLAADLSQSHLSTYLPNRIHPMTTRRQTANDDTLFWTLQANPGKPRRDTTHTWQKKWALMSAPSTSASKPWLKKAGSRLGNFSKNPDKLSYAYLLTPTGVAEKAALTRRFLQRKMTEYEKLRW